MRLIRKTRRVFESKVLLRLAQIMGSDCLLANMLSSGSFILENVVTTHSNS
jgi:hypothetical protein